MVTHDDFTSYRVGVTKIYFLLGLSSAQPPHRDAITVT
jgi:hypothetical protein